MIDLDLNNLIHQDSSRVKKDVFKIDNIEVTNNNQYITLYSLESSINGLST